MSDKHHNYEIRSLIVKEKNGESWAMVCYENVKNKYWEKELKSALKKVQEK